MFHESVLNYYFAQKLFSKFWKCNIFNKTFGSIFYCPKTGQKGALYE